MPTYLKEKVMCWAGDGVCWVEHVMCWDGVTGSSMAQLELSTQ